MSARVPAPAELLAQIDAASRVVDDLCAGRREWTMSIPADETRDPDLVIGGALHAARRALLGGGVSAEAQHRYLHDPVFHALVHQLRELIKSGEFELGDLAAAISIAAGEAEVKRREQVLAHFTNPALGKPW